MQAKINDQFSYDVSYKNQRFTINEKEIITDIQLQANGSYNLLMNHKSYNIQVEKVDKNQKEMVINVNQSRYTVAIKEDIDLLLEKMGINLNANQKAAPLKAPMPGMVLKVLVTEGQDVQKGDSLLILEAMKMENVLKASSNGKIKAIKAIEQTAVEKGAILIEME
jgi:biotin carboxyl carrier protein